MEYLVVWSIQIEADSHEHAAQLALDIQRDPDSTALSFGVQAEGEFFSTAVDLSPQPF